MAATTKHGASRTKSYKAWISLRDRCSNPNNRQWKDYGGRGIACDYENYEQFIADVGPRPNRSGRTEIDRINNNGNYAPGNCRWVTSKKNKENTRVSKVWHICGVEYASSVVAAKALGVTPSVIVRGCNGFTRDGIHHSPRPGWSCELKYRS